MKPVIIAMDFKSRAELESFLQPFNNEPLFLKIGMELYYKEGNQLIKDLKQKGHNIFLDLKLHDIPNTVSSALKNLVALDVDFITIHAAGGFNMMQAAAKAVENSKTKLLAVTILTSLSEEMCHNELLITNNYNVNQIATSYAQTAQKAGIHGVICSPFEAENIRKQTSNDFLIVTPGIRLPNDDANDQKRIMTPKEAIKAGANHIVVGRSITLKSNPFEVYKSVLN